MTTTCTSRNGGAALLQDDEDGQEVVCNVRLQVERSWQCWWNSTLHGKPFLTMESATVAPILQDLVDQDTWSRFRGHVLVAQFRGIPMSVRCSLLVLFVIWFIIFLSMPSSNFRFIFLIVVLLIEYATTRHLQSRSLPTSLQRILTKMEPTFARQGVSLKLDSYLSGLLLCERCYFVRVARCLPKYSIMEQGDNNIMAVNNSNNNNEHGSAVYRPQDWKPWEGTWVKTNEVVENPSDIQTFQGFFQEKSLVWTVTGTSMEGTFDLKKEVHFSLCHVFPKHSISFAKAVGNAIEHIGTTSRQERLLKQMRITPLHVEEHGDALYKQGDCSIIHIDAPRERLTKYCFEFAEDVPTSKEAALVAGALPDESNLPERGVMIVFEKKKQAETVPETMKNHHLLV